MRFGWLGAGAALAICIVSVSAGCSQSSARSLDDESPAATSQAIQGGTEDGLAHPFAIGICSNRNQNGCGGYCSGTLILPNLVVTARHCIDQTEKIIDCSVNPQFGGRKNGLWITTHNKMNNNPSTGWHEVKSIAVPADDHVCGHDIALLVLKDQVADTEAKPAIPGVQYPMGDLNRYVRRFTAIGYGNTGPEGFSAGTRRIRQNIPVVCIPGDDFAACPASVNENEFIGGDGTCEGDSGSSAFDDKTLIKGAPVSFGVLSRGGDNSVDGGPATFCKGSLYTRLDKYRDLVVKAAEAASNNWTLYPKPVPDWTLYVPPPPDAGVPDAKPKTNLAEGVACNDNSECKSKVCADTGAGKACTQACDESVVPTDCQEGFICKQSVCVQDLGGGPVEPAPVATAAPTTTTTTGCSIGPAGDAGHDGRLPAGALAVAGAAAILGLRRRARRG